MKKLFILIAALAAFSFTAHAAPAAGTCVNVQDALKSGTSEAAILGDLKLPICDMGLQAAVCTIIDAGGTQSNTIAAAMKYDAEYKYDEVACVNYLASTAAGGPLAAPAAGANRTIAFAGPQTAGGGGSAVSP